MAKKNKVIILLISVCVIVFGLLYTYNYKKENLIYSDKVVIESKNIYESSILSENIEIEKEEIEEEIKVYICGAVNTVQVVTLKKGSRIIDALELVGGANEEADLNNINLASIISDGQKIYIPKMGEEVDKIEFSEENSNSTNIINTEFVDINKATKIELQILPGIGETIAEYIIEYRTQNGEFKNIEELKNVTRIGEKTFEKIKDKIIIGK